MTIAVVLVPVLVIWTLAGIMLLRNERVYRYRIGLNNLCYQRGMDDIEAGRMVESRRWHAALLAGPSYTEMVCRFWMPLRRFEWPEPLDAELRS